MGFRIMHTWDQVENPAQSDEHGIRFVEAFAIPIMMVLDSLYNYDYGNTVQQGTSQRPHRHTGNYLGRGSKLIRDGAADVCVAV